MYSLVFATPKDIFATYLIIMTSCIASFPITMFFLSIVKGVKNRW
ncbi:hypothetical protein LH47_02301 [Anoxybacillus thermarum]|uniref:Uncharacterized protein n=1 Tax=Anoxybacillus thermarum TaxID=404937 RepID=A0A0D0RW71_9BACL|nr:hypothetical protein LH47_02301 [Anoxybacillus thermarum]